MKKQFLSIKEIFIKYPELRTNFYWTKSDIGLLMKSKLLSGYYSRNKRSSMIEENSLIRLIQYVNRSLDEQLVIL